MSQESEAGSESQSSSKRRRLDDAEEDEDAEENGDAEEQERSKVFECKLDDTDHLIALLQTILLDKDQLVECQISEMGIRFSVTKSKILQAKAYIKKSMFSEFNLESDEEDEEDGTEICFTLNLHVLLQCLQIFGGSSHMQMSYSGYGAPVCLTLEDSGVITQCEIVTLEPPSNPDFHFRSVGIVNRLAIKSRILKDAFSELDVPGATFINIRVSPREPNFTMSVEGDSSNCKVDFPNEEQLFTQFEAKEETVTKYGLPIIRPCIRALAKAEHTSLKWNANGMLSMQHSIPTANAGGSSWVEFLLLAQDHIDPSQSSSASPSTTQSDTT
eukprot:gb/GEZN01010049.1/.p1 GENE.gb/GEZN01010049.1/~~gb/GEZN01010049.1/.p1  ORF type:complete len:329 (-),score=48.03 gb/GEZN01010049.1/:217-1203(-)